MEVIVPNLAAVFTFLFSNVMCSECEVTHVKSLRDKMQIGEPANFTIYFSSVNLAHKNYQYTSREMLELLFFHVSYNKDIKMKYRREKNRGKKKKKKKERETIQE